jgi:tRNA-splicing ligase RtcB
MSETEDLEEAPGSYKDIGEVMNNQKDLVKIVVELTPLAVVKARKVVYHGNK